MGDFVIGYGKCVRVQSLGSGSPPPNDNGGFDIASAGYYEDGSKRILRFTRPYQTSIPGHVSICADYEPDCTPPGVVHNSQCLAKICPGIDVVVMMPWHHTMCM